MRRFADSQVASRFKGYPPGVRPQLMALRALIFDTAARTEGVGPLTETLKWGQPSYLTEESGSGTTVRLDCLKAADGYAVYFNCHSGLLGRFRELYPDTFKFEGKRAIVFAVGDRVPAGELRHCLALAFTHHSKKKKPKS